MRGIRALTLVMISGALLGLGTGTACKGGEELTDASITVNADFVEQAVPPGVNSNLVRIVKGTVKGDLIVLDVLVTEVSDPVSGIALKLSYPSGFAKFSKCIDGDLLPSPGTCFFAEPAAGEVFIGRSIQAPQKPAPVTGSRVIVRIQFLLTRKGSGDIIVEAQNLAGGDASALLDANGDPILVQWFSGALSAN